MPRPSFDFYFEFASTYSHLTALRIRPLAAAAGVELRYRPMLLGPIFARQGWNDSPFNLYPEKGRYMWRDVARQAERYGLPFRKPSAFPRAGLLAARVATAALGEPFLPDFVESVYRANFAEDRDTQGADVIAALLVSLGADAERWLARAGEADVKASLRATTEEAVRVGIFGAPSFVVEGELFWGDDRLEQALAWAARA
jgi:2-hydroxychromene-2-carboxylate isomerase